MDIGHIVEADVLKLALELGIDVSLPFGGQLRYDQIWDINGKLYKIQIKHAEEFKNGSYIKFANRTKGSKYEAHEIDAIVTAYKNKLYYIPQDKLSAKEKRLYFYLEKEDAMNYHQVHWAKDYEIEKQLNLKIKNNG